MELGLKIHDMGYKIAIIADNHFVYSDDGKVYVNGTYTQQYLARFLEEERLME